MDGTTHQTPGEPAVPASTPGEAAHHAFVQAPIRPLDEDGTTAALVGTVLFALATVVMVLLRHRLDARGDGWWPWVGVVGTALGVVGWVYCRRRAARRPR